MKKSRRALSIVLSVVMVLSCFTMLMISSGASNGINVSAYNDSKYKPTQIINGSFDECPWMTYTGTYGPMSGVVVDSFATWKTYADQGYKNYMNQDKHKDVQINGVDEGWNTTETSYLNGANFEWDDGYGNGVSHGEIWGYNSNLVESGHFFVEMNLDNSAVLYQDLTTHSGDVIRWSLKHGVRIAFGDETQAMRVEVGAPDGDASGINENVNSSIKEETKAVYESTGFSGANAYANNDELAGLSLSQTSNDDKWYDSKGVYIVPANQDVTRFAFVSISNGVIGAGNMLDDISFSTLLGNLNGIDNGDGTATVTGYWGETDTNKKFKIQIGNETYSLDMSNYIGKGFKIDIPADVINGADSVKVWHEDYEAASKTVSILPEPDTITLGTFDRKTKTFCDAEGNGIGKYGCVAIYVGNEISDGDAITLPAGYSKSANSDDYKIYVNLSETATAEDIAENLISKIIFKSENEQNIRVELLPNEPGKAYFYCEENDHYYTFVDNTTCTWIEAYDAARNMQYNGRQGYLATVTSKTEDTFIYEASGNKVGWLGSSRLAPSNKDGNYYNSFSTTEFTDNWCWSCGPEIGTEFFDTKDVRDEYNDNRNPSVINVIFTRNAGKEYYFNWGFGEPSAGDNENALTTLMTGSGYSTGSEISSYAWNDILYDRDGGKLIGSGYNPTGYLVEFGDLTVGDSNTAVNPSADGLVTTWVNVTNVEYVPAKGTTNTYEVTINGRPNMVQFISLDHGNGTLSRSFDRHHEKVSIVSYNAAGEEVSDTSKDIAYEIWTVTTSISEDTVGVRAKVAGSSKWEDQRLAYTFENVYVKEQSGLVSAKLESTEGAAGPVKFTVVTGKDAQYVQVKNEENGSCTLSAAKAVDNGDGTLTFTGKIYANGSGEKKMTVRILDTYGWKTVDTLTYTIK